MKHEILSVIVPVLNEEESIPLFLEKMRQVSRELPVEVEYWFVNDGSNDNTQAVLNALNNSDSNIHFIDFSRNFGKEAALYAGLEYAKGDYIGVMDVDLQDPPELLPEMLRGVMSGEWDAVGSRRINRIGESRIRSFFSDLFYKLVNKISSTQLVNGARDYRVMTRQMVDAILSMPEYNRFSKGIFSWIGFRTKYLEFENVDRAAGKTSWSFFSLFKYSIDGIVNFSTAPLDIVTGLGFITFISAIIGAIAIIIRAIAFPSTAVFGWPSMVVIMLLLSGIQLLSLGVIGRYISGTYTEVKRRPIFIAKKVK